MFHPDVCAQSEQVFKRGGAAVDDTDDEGEEVVVEEYSYSSLKVLDHAMCNAAGTDNCMKFIEVYGLHTLFPQFMKTPKTKKHGGLSE